MVRVSMGERTPSGVYKQRSRTFRARTKREAKEKAADWAAMIRAEQDNGTFRALAEAWFEAGHPAPGRVGRKPSTQRGYRTKLDKHILPVLGRVELIDLDRQTMAAWQDGLEVGGRTKNQLVSIVRSIVRWGYKRGRISTEDCLAPLATQTAGLEHTEAPTADALRTLLRHLQGPDGDALVAAVVFLAATTGARRGELLGLKVGDVNLEVGSLRIVRSIDRTGPVEPKTAAGRRIIALPVETVAVLSSWVAGLERFYRRALGDPSFTLGPERWLFPSPVNLESHWYPEAISKAVKRHVLAAGLPMGAVQLHRLRNYSITALADGGVPSKAIADRHGHAHIAITEGVYMGRLSEQDRLAAGIIGRNIGELLE